MTTFIYFTTASGSIGMQECKALLTTYEFATTAEAENYQQQLAAHYGTTAAARPQRSTGAIRHVGTGTTYESAAAAAQAHNVTRSAMSQHLNHRERYPTIRGHVFERTGS